MKYIYYCQSAPIELYMYSLWITKHFTYNLCKADTHTYIHTHTQHALCTKMEMSWKENANEDSRIANGL